MTKYAYELIENTDEYVLVRDLCMEIKDRPVKSLTNVMEDFVDDHYDLLLGKRLFYIDTSNCLDEVVLSNGAFSYFEMKRRDFMHGCFKSPVKIGEHDD